MGLVGGPPDQTRIIVPCSRMVTHPYIRVPCLHLPEAQRVSGPAPVAGQADGQNMKFFCNISTALHEILQATRSQTHERQPVT